MPHVVEEVIKKETKIWASKAGMQPGGLMGGLRPIFIESAEQVIYGSVKDLPIK